MVYNYTQPRREISAMYSSPGPSQYGLPTLVGREHHDPRSVHTRGPASPLGNRHKHALKDEAGPGPAYLPDARMYRTGKDGTPHATVIGRVRDPQWFSAPGPGAYYPEHSTKKVKPAEPAYSLASRQKPSQLSDTPGPNVYQPCYGKTFANPKHQAPSYSISGRPKTGDIDKKPGPSDYKVPEITVIKRSSPKHSVTGRVNPPPSDALRKPGPEVYRHESVWAHKREPPRFSFGIRHSQYSSTLITSADNAF